MNRRRFFAGIAALAATPFLPAVPARVSGNSVLTPDLIMREALRVMSNSSKLHRLMRGNALINSGSTIRVRLPARHRG